MARLDELRLMTRVARLYYESGARQPEIALRLRLSQPKVSRLLKQALDEGIVRITVGAPTGTHPDLEVALEERYGLEEAEVVDIAVEDDERIVHEVGAAAAYLLETTVRSGDVIGVSSWSATLLAMVNAMHPVTTVHDTRVVQILGGGGDPAAEGHATHLVRRLAHLLHGEGTFLPAPSSVGSPQARDVLLEDPFVQRAMRLFDRLDIALVGIGGLQPSGLLASSGNVFSADELATVQAAGGVGDIGLRYLRADGLPVETPLHDRVIGIELEQLRHVPRAIGVAGGATKTAAIRAAMLGGWINCLVTDRLTAERLLEPRPDEARPTQRPSWPEREGPDRPRMEGRLVGADVR
jgi:DNA-binding transcriptional regulator LsrR (DeoR family)